MKIKLGSSIGAHELRSHDDFIISMAAEINFNSPIMSFHNPDQVDCIVSSSSIIDILDQLCPNDYVY